MTTLLLTLAFLSVSAYFYYELKPKPKTPTFKQFCEGDLAKRFDENEHYTDNSF